MVVILNFRSISYVWFVGFDTEAPADSSISFPCFGCILGSRFLKLGALVFCLVGVLRNLFEEVEV